MNKKFRCTVCGYIHEGNEAPERCPLCKVPADKFVEIEEQNGNLEFVTEHLLGDGKGASAELLEGLKNHFMGECTEVGMYLAMSRQADREGYPEIAEAYKRYAWEEAEHAAKFAELLGEVVWDTKTIAELMLCSELKVTALLLNLYKLICRDFAKWATLWSLISLVNITAYCATKFL